MANSPNYSSRFLLSAFLMMAVVSLSLADHSASHSPSPAPELAHDDTSSPSSSASSSSAQPSMAPSHHVHGSVPAPASSPSPSSPPAPPPADLAPSSEHSPSPSPEAKGAFGRIGVVDDGSKDNKSSKGMSAGKKAGIAFGVILSVCAVGVAGFVYKKRQRNIQRAQFGYAARREIL